MAPSIWLTCAVTFLFCGLGFAQPAPTPVVSLILPMGDVDGDVHWMGSVITAVPTATTYSLNCHRPTEGDEEDNLFEEPGPECGLQGITLVQGPATYSLVVTMPPTVTFDYNCQLEGATRITRATCTGGQVVTQLTENTMETATIAEPDITSIPVTVTAGAEKLSAPPPTEMVTPTADAASPRITGAVHWAVGGMAAAALAGAV